MRKFFGLGLFAATAVLLAGPASADIWNLDFDTGLDADGNQITFAGETIFSDPDSSRKWQRYDGKGSVAPDANGALPYRTNPSDGGIPGSNGVKVNIDVWNGRGEPGFAVGFDTRNMYSRDNDLEAPFNPSPSESQTNGYGNVLIIQSHENYYTEDCGGGRLSGGNGLCRYQTNASQTHGHTKSDDEAYGGDIVFDFDQEVTLLKMNYFDIEENENYPKARVKLYDENDNVILTKYLTPVGDHGVGLLTFYGDIGVKAHKMMVWLPGSGAIDNIMGDTGTTTQITEPGVLALFGVGLFAMGVYRRRREVVTPDA
jgi:hypothetical protein